MKNFLVKVSFLAVFSLFLLAISLPAHADQTKMPPEVAANVHKLMKTGECINCNLAGANLVRANLVGADLSNANLSGANLKLANMAGAKLNGANLSGAHFGGADLYKADLSGATMTGTILTGSYQKGAKIDRVHVDPRLQEAATASQGIVADFPPVQNAGVSTEKPAVSAAKETPKATKVNPLELKESAPEKFASPTATPDKADAKATHAKGIKKKSLWGRMGGFVKSLNPFSKDNAKKEEPGQALQPVRGKPAPVVKKETTSPRQPIVTTKRPKPEVAPPAPVQPEPAKSAASTSRKISAKKAAPTPQAKKAPEKKSPSLVSKITGSVGGFFSGIFSKEKKEADAVKTAPMSATKQTAPEKKAVVSTNKISEKTTAIAQRHRDDTPVVAQTPPAAQKPEPVTEKTVTMPPPVRHTESVGQKAPPASPAPKQKKKPQTFIGKIGGYAGKVGSLFTGLFSSDKQVQTKMPATPTKTKESTGDTSVRIQGLRQVDGKMGKKSSVSSPIPKAKKRAVPPVAQKKRKKSTRPLPDPAKAISLKTLEKTKKCVRCDLRHLNLIGVDLEEADLERSDMEGVSLMGADLRETNLKGVVLRDADLRNARLQNADLYKADLSGADLTGASFKGATLDSAVMDGVKGADLTGAILTP